MRHPQNQAFGALNEAVAPLDFFGPVFVGQRDVAFLIQQKGVFGALATKQVQLAVGHLPAVGVPTPRNAEHDAIGAIAAVLRQVFGRRLVKGGLALGAGKPEINALVGAAKFGLALHIGALSEIGGDVSAFQKQALLGVVCHGIDGLVTA